MGLTVSVVGGLNVGALSEGWTRETVVILLGSTRLDFSRTHPAPKAELTLLSLFGGARITVPPGTRVTLDGVSVLGGRRIQVEPANGPEIHIRFFSLVGGIRVNEAAET